MKLIFLYISIIITFPVFAVSEPEQLYRTTYQSIIDQNYQLAAVQAEKLLKVSKNQNNQWFIVQSYFLKAFIHEKNEKFGKAALSYLEAARYSENSSDQKIRESLISIYKNLAVILGNYKHYDLAHKFNCKGLALAQETNNQNQIISLLQNEGNEYYEEQKFDSTISIINQALSNYNPGFRKRIGFINNLGLAYWNQGKPDKAIRYYQSILVLQDSIHDPEFIAKVHHNLALALMDKNQYEESIINLKKAEEINTKEGYSNILFGNYKNLGKSFYSLGDKEKAIGYYLQAAKLFDEEYVDPEDYDVFKLIGEFYYEHNQPELAREYEVKYSQHLEDFIARQKEIEELDKKYNMELLTQRYFDLLEVQETHQQSLHNVELGLGAGIILLLIILAHVLYRQHYRKLAIARDLRMIEDSSEV